VRVLESRPFRTVPKEYDSKWMDSFVSTVSDVLAEHAKVINGGLGFGDGIDYDNLMGKWISYTTNSTKDTEDTLTHNLGAIPIGFILLKPPTSGAINRGATTWTTSRLYLQCSAAAQTAEIFVIIPSHGIIE
jgi:hypothetical protein